MDSISRNAVNAIATQLATSAFTAGVTLYLVRALGPDGYGVFALALSIGAVLLLPSDFGISQATARFMAELRDDKDTASALYADAFRLRLMGSLVLAVVLVASSDLIADAYGQPQLTWVVRGVALAVFGQSLLMLNNGVLTALGRLGVYFRIVLSESAIEAGATVTLVLLGGGAAGAAFGRAAGYLAGGLIAVVAVVRLLGVGTRRRGLGLRSGYGRRLMGYAGALFIVDGVFTLFETIDIILIGAYLDASAVGLFQAPLRLAIFLHYPGLAIASAVAPRLARSRDTEPNVAAFETALRLIVIVQLGLAAATFAWAQPIVEVALGPEYRGSVDTLRALAPYIFLSGVAPLVSLAANYLGEARRRVPIAILTVLVNIAIDIILIPRIGIVAGAIGTGVAYALYVPAHLWICQRMLGINLRRLGITTLRGLLASGALAGVLAMVGTSTLSPLQWIAGFALAPLVFGGVLLLSGEVSRAELNGVRSRVSQLVRRGA
jgi:O-antigen/teichoic acid export membrane protein